MAKRKIWINQDLVKMIESTPDTILCFVDGSRMPVLETPEQVQKKIIELLNSIKGLHIKE